MGVEMTICANQIANSSDEDDDNPHLNQMAKEIYQNTSDHDHEGDSITDYEFDKHKPSNNDVESKKHLKIIITPQQIPQKTKRRKTRRSERKHSRQRSRSLTFLTTDNTKPKKKKKSPKKRKSKSSKKRAFSSSKRKVRRQRSSPLKSTRHHQTEKHDLLQAQYDLLRKQNQQFIAKHGSFFAEAYDTNSSSSSPSSSSSSSSSSMRKLSLDPQHSLTSSHSAHSNASSASSRGSHASSSSFMSSETMSPLSTLSGFHANIILTYSDSSFPFPTPPELPQKERSYSVPNAATLGVVHDKLYPFSNSMDVLNLSEIADQPESCECVANCKSIKRVMTVLKWYASHCNHDDEEVLLERIKRQFVVKGYDGYLMRDYQHILDYHLTQQQEIHMGMEYALIKHELIKHVGFCDVVRCKGYKRYRGSLGKKSDDRLFLLDFMDLVHCFLMHLEHLQ